MPIAMAAMMPPLSCMPGWGPKIYTRTGSKNKKNKKNPNFLLRSYLGYLMKLMHSDKKKKKNMPKMLTLVILLQINLYIISVFVFL